MRLIIYGRNSVEEALLENLSLREVMVDLKKKEKFEKLIDRLEEKKIPIRFLNEKMLDQISRTFKHQGIIAQMDLPPNVMEEESGFDRWEDLNTVLVLDGVTDTGNLGAIIRSAALFSFDAVFLPNDSSARITPQTIKASAGALYYQKIIYVNNINTLITQLKAEEFFVYGLAGESKVSIEETPFKGKICLVVGSEREGIRKSVKKNCDTLVKIPTTKKIDSLNVSVASAIAMWEVYKKAISH
jgi:23S rRNA (guanosine2251-2'-O)-methyltransferase